MMAHTSAGNWPGTSSWFVMAPTPAASFLANAANSGLTGGVVAVRRRAIFVVAEGQCPHPRRSYGGRFTLRMRPTTERRQNPRR
jgi:hypothetical protein